MDFRNERTQDPLHIEVDETAKSTLLEMSRWTKFLAILGFISLGLIVIGGGFVGAVLNNMGYTGNPVFAAMGALGIFMFYLLIAAIEFYPIYALLKYSTNIKASLQTGDQLRFNTALRYQKNMFKYMGIMAIIMLSLYGLIIIAVIVGAAMR